MTMARLGIDFGTTNTVTMPCRCGTSRLRARSSNIAARDGVMAWRAKNLS